MTGPTRWEQLSVDRPITTTGQLLVEGRSSEMFFREMIDAIELIGPLEVRTFGDVSKPNLQGYLELFTSKPAFKEKVRRIGIIRDAERSSATAAFGSVQAALRGAGLPVPDRMAELEGSPLRVAVFILPNCQDTGMLEGLCLEAVTAAEQGLADAVLPCVEEFFVCLERRGRGSPLNATKAKFSGYALARDVIDPQLGRAAQKHVIPWEATTFDQLKAFLRMVAGDQQSVASASSTFTH